MDYYHANAAERNAAARMALLNLAGQEKSNQPKKPNQPRIVKFKPLTRYDGKLRALTFEIGNGGITYLAIYPADILAQGFTPLTGDFILRQYPANNFTVTTFTYKNLLHQAGHLVFKLSSTENPENPENKEQINSKLERIGKDLYTSINFWRLNKPNPNNTLFKVDAQLLLFYVAVKSKNLDILNRLYWILTKAPKKDNSGTNWSDEDLFDIKIPCEKVEIKDFAGNQQLGYRNKASKVIMTPQSANAEIKSDEISRTFNKEQAKLQLKAAQEKLKRLKNITDEELKAFQAKNPNISIEKAIEAATANVAAAKITAETAAAAVDGFVLV